ncbi:putative NLI interacting factor-like phosphatase [Rosellinia necatrix]|uniref:Mitochondrial import inner membrane translocase subunit TIM50 n=1 Tax=Rosellinia necatrix TaxID=77044 RepID=A0A1W2TBG3_ROSNE|nr:putative NLI interacting factor-like phosphatase [Rosellinia necatrix]
MLSRALAQGIARSAPPRSLQRAPIFASAIPRLAAPSSRLWARGMAQDKGPKSQTTPPSQPKPQPEAQQPPSSPPPTHEPSVDAAEPATPPPDFGSLPDLTRGIPSTLEYERAGATKKSELSALQESGEGAQTEGGGGRTKGELPASAYLSSTDKRRAQFANRMYLAVLVGGIAGLGYLGREWSEEEAAIYKDIPSGWAPALIYKRAVARLSDVTEYYREPAFDKLLPEPHPMFERPYTLCISLEDMLVHSEWSREHGWRVAKRPGIDYFLRYLSQYYELVLFTSVPIAMGEPIMRKLDPFQIVVWPLYREATKYKDGEIVKDLSYLNRDLSKVIIIDTKESHVQNQPENAIILPPWKGAKDDKDLVSLIPFLEYIFAMEYKDVREVLKSFKGKHIPTEFARREAIARAEFQKQLDSQKRKVPSGIGALSSMLGVKGNMSMMQAPDGEVSPAEAFAQGKMLQDVIRERGQKNYEALEKQIRENGEQWLKEAQQMQEQQQAEVMNSMKSSFTSWFRPSPPDPSTPPKSV